MSGTRAIIIEEPVPYPDAVALQERLVAERIDGQRPDTVIFLQHTPVITLGSRGSRRWLLKTGQELQDLGIDLQHASRGGDITYHAPGQLVMYPIIKLGEREADTHGYLHNLEEISIRTLADFGIKSYRRPGMTGAWTDHGKVTAIGIRLKRWVTLHGLALNIDLDLSPFTTIVPCGLENEPVASLEQILGARCPALAEVRTAMLDHFSTICAREIKSTRHWRNINGPARSPQ